MQFATQWINVAYNLASGQQPDHALLKPKGEIWVAQTALLAPAIEWGVTRLGDYVRIPVHAYAVPMRSQAALFGLAIQLGALAIVDLRRMTGEVPLEMFLVLGDVVTDLAPLGGFRGYAGVAVRTK